MKYENKIYFQLNLLNEISTKYYFFLVLLYVKNYLSLKIKRIIQLNVIGGSECTHQKN
jgi:hypothetical protein